MPVNNILNFKDSKSLKTKFYERTAEEDVIYKHHLKIKTKPEDFAKFLPKMQNEDLYQLFFHYYCEWHRLNCGDSCKGPEIMEYCFSLSKNIKEFFKKMFYCVNQTKLVENAKSI
jgi:hypothetical protein